MHASFILFFIIVDEIAAIKDMWFLGDAFLKEMYHTLQTMKIRPGHDRSRPNYEPYLHKQYNVRSYYDLKNFSSENALSRIFNALIRGLEENARKLLPRYIVIILGEDFFRMINHTDYGVSLMIGKCLEWMMANLE